VQLELPSAGYGSARRPTARRNELFSDWIEAQAFLLESAVSKPWLVERLDGSKLVKNEADAWTLVSDCFALCRQRRKSIGAPYPFSIAGDALEYSGEGSAYTFCLLASLPEQFVELREGYPATFRDIFEAVVAESLRSSFPRWDVLETGWAKIAEEGRKQAIRSIADFARGKFLDETVFKQPKDAQVDVALRRAFSDERPSFPVIMGQCATGVTDWKDKAIRPNLDRWQKAVQFSATPTKLFAVPFAFDHETFWFAATESSGLVLERTRITAALGAIPAQLAGQISAWLEQAKPLIPTLEM
jgi:hypothetical protein